MFFGSVLLHKHNYGCYKCNYFIFGSNQIEGKPAEIEAVLWYETDFSEEKLKRLFVNSNLFSVTKLNSVAVVVQFV